MKHTRSMIVASVCVAIATVGLVPPGPEARVLSPAERTSTTGANGNQKQDHYCASNTDYWCEIVNELGGCEAGACDTCQYCGDSTGPQTITIKRCLPQNKLRCDNTAGPYEMGCDNVSIWVGSCAARCQDGWVDCGALTASIHQCTVETCSECQ